MGKPAAVIGAICSGHGGFPPRANIGGSGNVLIGGVGAIRAGDPWSVHCCPQKGCHASTQASGSGSVFINGLPAARIGDSVACGSVIASSNSSNVSIG